MFLELISPGIVRNIAVRWFVVFLWVNWFGKCATF